MKTNIESALEKLSNDIEEYFNTYDSSEAKDLFMKMFIPHVDNDVNDEGEYIISTNVFNGDIES